MPPINFIPDPAGGITGLGYFDFTPPSEEEIKAAQEAFNKTQATGKNRIDTAATKYRRISNK